MRIHPKAIMAIMGDSPPQTYPTWGLPTGLQLFMNCSSVSPFPRVMASFGCSHLLWRGVLHGLQTDVRPPLTSMVCRGSACHLTSGCWKLCSGTPRLLLLHWPWSLHTCFSLTSDCSPPLKKTKEKKLHSRFPQWLHKPPLSSWELYRTLSRWLSPGYLQGKWQEMPPREEIILTRTA